MSRVDYDDSDSDYPQLDQGRWERNRGQVLTSKRGKQALLALRAALLALPTKRLIDDEFATPDEIIGDGPVAVLEGDVCVVAAYARYKGFAQEDLVRRSEELSTANSTAWFARDHLGLRFTLGWVLVELNDDAFAGYTPEMRYEKVLSWIESYLREEA